MSEQLKLGRYQHFKGMIVEVIRIAFHSETMEEMVVYIHQDPIKGKDGNTMWVRPKSMFLEKVEKDGKQIPRFRYLENDTDKIILATSSPYRINRFRKLGINFTTESSKVDEYHDGRPSDPEELVKYLARLKAQAVAKNHSQGIIIGLDSVGWFNQQILEKPKSRQEEFERLKLLSGGSHEFYTGVHMINLDNNRVLTEAVKTKISMGELEEDEINKKLDQDSGLIPINSDYSSKGFDYGVFIKSIEGSYNNFLCGLPIERIRIMLKEIKSN